MQMQNQKELLWQKQPILFKIHLKQIFKQKIFIKMSSNNETFQNFNGQNYDPNSFAQQTGSAIMFALVADISISIRDYEVPMSEALDDIFLHELKNSHRKDDILLSKVTFGEHVKHELAYMPIMNVQPGMLAIKGVENRTALYRAVLEAMKSAMSYRNDLEAQGVDVRTNICIITDGDDNWSNQSDLDELKELIAGLRRKEEWASSFTITLIGVGQQAQFKNAVLAMGLDPVKSLVEISTSAHDIRKMMAVVSQSASSSAAGQAVQF